MFIHLCVRELYFLLFEYVTDLAAVQQQHRDDVVATDKQGDG